MWVSQALVRRKQVNAAQQVLTPLGYRPFVPGISGREDKQCFDRLGKIPH
jgi:hypothetical protein